MPLLGARRTATLRTHRLSAAIRAIVPPRRQKTLRDLMLQGPRLFNQRVEPLEEGSEFLGGEKALLAH